MAVQVRDTAAGKSISAYIVLNKKGVHVATINVHFGNSRVSVDVWNLGDKAIHACRVAAIKSGALKPEAFVKAVEASKVKRDWGNGQDHESHATYDLFGFQQGSASGYGYDKYTAALSGLWIDGHQLADHSRGNAQTERLLVAYQKATAKCETVEAANEVRKAFNDKAAKIGAFLTNYRSCQDDRERGFYGSCYLESGLSRLEKLGYTVIQAI